MNQNPFQDFVGQLNFKGILGPESMTDDETFETRDVIGRITTLLYSGEVKKQEGASAQAIQTWNDASVKTIYQFQTRTRPIEYSTDGVTYELDAPELFMLCIVAISLAVIRIDIFIADLVSDTLVNTQASMGPVVITLDKLKKMLVAANYIYSRLTSTWRS